MTSKRVPDSLKAFASSDGGASAPDMPLETTQFGDTPELADELGQLVLEGKKIATCSALWEYEAEGMPLPIPGKRSVVVDGKGDPLCIIETTSVGIRAFCDVDAQFAWEEGEGDRSLESWRREHWDIFTRSLSSINRFPSDDMPLVCERFKLVFVE